MQFEKTVLALFYIYSDSWDMFLQRMSVNTIFNIESQ